jgi:acyl-CoA thioesterase
MFANASLSGFPVSGAIAREGNAFGKRRIQAMQHGNEIIVLCMAFALRL